MNLTELIRAIIDRNLCTCQASEENKRLLTEAIVKAIPKREHGEWINHYDDLFPAESTIECSVCHEEQYYAIDTNFCPNCGADMRALVHTAKEPIDDCVAIEFSTDANVPNRWQGKDGKWHTEKIPTKAESEDNK